LVVDALRPGLIHWTVALHQAEHLDHVARTIATLGSNLVSQDARFLIRRLSQMKTSTNTTWAKWLLMATKVLALVGAVGWIVVRGVFDLAIAQNVVTRTATIVVLLVGIPIAVARWWPRKDAGSNADKSNGSTVNDSGAHTRSPDHPKL
jgi:hypothetical protein